jgi:Tfp pilus assembly protein PilV
LSLIQFFCTFQVSTRAHKLDSKKRMAGVTITEVVVASALLLTAIVPILKALTSAQLTTRIIEHRSCSLILAQAKLDEIKARSIYDYTNGSTSFNESNTDLGGSYLCNVTDDTNDPLKQISVSVGHDLNGDKSLAGDEIEVTLTTCLARRWPGP